MTCYNEDLQVSDILHGYIYREAANHGEIIAETDALVGPSGNTDINITSILTPLIQITGRFCESYASDLLMQLNKLYPFMKPKWPMELNRWTIPFGIRAQGVDHHSFIVDRLLETKKGTWSDYVYPEQVYRKLLVVDIIDAIDSSWNDSSFCKRTIRLVDITHSLYKIPESVPMEMPTADTQKEP